MAAPVLVRLYRGQVGRSEEEGVDVSQKSAGPIGRPFAPPWDLVMGSKRGEIDWSTYRSRYFQQLFHNQSAPVFRLWEEGVRLGGELAVLCYCPMSNSYCHTVLLIQWLTECYPMHFEVKL